MELILNTNKDGYKPFIDLDVDSFIVGLKGYSLNQFFEVSLKELTSVIQEIKNKGKKIYLSINIFSQEKETLKLKKFIPQLKNYDLDGIILSDLGLLNIFKENGLESKVVLDLQTYVTNKYSAKSLLDQGIKRVVLSKEITLKDMQEIANFTDNKVEILVQGYYPITYSKRPILSCYMKHFKLKKKSALYYIREESRDKMYILIENKRNLTVFNDKQYSLLNNIEELSNINSFRIDTNFLTIEEVRNYINIYRQAINYIKEKDLKSLARLKEEFNKNEVYDTPFLHCESVLLKEGK